MPEDTSYWTMKLFLPFQFKITSKPCRRWRTKLLTADWRQYYKGMCSDAELVQIPLKALNYQMQK